MSSLTREIGSLRFVQVYDGAWRAVSGFIGFAGYGRTGCEKCHGRDAAHVSRDE